MQEARIVVRLEGLARALFFGHCVSGGDLELRLFLVLLGRRRRNRRGGLEDGRLRLWRRQVLETKHVFRQLERAQRPGQVDGVSALWTYV